MHRPEGTYGRLVVGGRAEFCYTVSSCPICDLSHISAGLRHILVLFRNLKKKRKRKKLAVVKYA